jgi:hypothetical protein
MQQEQLEGKRRAIKKKVRRQIEGGYKRGRRKHTLLEGRAVM